MPKNCSIVLADQHFQDRATGKHLISGTFASCMADTLPLKFTCGVYVALEDVSPPLTLELFLSNPVNDNLSPLAKWEVHSLDFPNGEIVEMGIQLIITVNAYGIHRIIVKNGDTTLGTRPIMVKKVGGVNELSN